jgi:putative nucleotidyltransferase with HDIG domain
MGCRGAMRPCNPFFALLLVHLAPITHLTNKLKSLYSCYEGKFFSEGQVEREIMDISPNSPSWLSGVARIQSLLTRWLVEPSRKIQDPASRRQTRLLSFFLICLFILFLSVNLAYLFTIPGYRIPVADMIGYGVLIATYILSRTRLTRVAVVVLLVMFPLNVFENILSGTSYNLVVTLSFLLPSYILASIFLTSFWMGVFGYGVNLIVYILPVLAPQTVPRTGTIIGPLAVGLISVTLLIIFVENRNQIERDRQAELRKAYDNTLEGWSRALELRDKETEGHSQRVTRLTLLLARACGLRGEELENIYRGALLHDIGKMAIPDAILSKKGPLDREEWIVMRTHPQIAYDMLSEIAFLKPAMVVPANHHEWWNGKGYPSGLCRDEIPLPARIFAVVDVWDALLSDRPYRKAWNKDAVLQYLKDQSGVQFDPAVVERFLALNP